MPKGGKRKRVFALPTRVRILKDDDGHTYLVPVNRVAEFKAWLAAAPDYWEGYTGEDLSDWALGSHLSCYTFGNPEEA